MGTTEWERPTKKDGETKSIRKIKRSGREKTSLFDSGLLGGAPGPHLNENGDNKKIASFGHRGGGPINETKEVPLRGNERGRYRKVRKVVEMLKGLKWSEASSQCEK